MFDCITADETYLSETLSFAAKRGLKRDLLCWIAYLRRHGGRGHQNKVKLFKDFAPHSFVFYVERPDGYKFNGGLIYYGAGDTGVSEPQFTVRLDSSKEGWSIHT